MVAGVQPQGFIAATRKKLTAAAGFSCRADRGRDEVGGNWTHDITLGDIEVVSVGGIYYQFLLDINEPSGQGGTPLLSLDDVKIYTSTTAHLNYKTNLADLGVLRYNMDAGGNSRVELNYDLNPQLQGPGGGSGTGDMAMLVPVSAFGGAGPGTFLYLYSHFGNPNSSGDGFEEWWTVHPQLIPLPAGVWAGAAGLAGLGGFGWMRRRGAAALMQPRQTGFRGLE